MICEGYHLVETAGGSAPPEPTPQARWEYGGLRHLSSGLPPAATDPSAQVTDRTAEVCVYRSMFLDAGTPFVLFALHRHDNELRWPKATVLDASVPGDRLLSSVERRIVAAFAALGPATSYRGWRQGPRGVQLWFEIECAHDRASDARSGSGWRWALASDIVNEGHVAGDSIAAEVGNDLSQWPDACVMYASDSGAAAPPVQAAYFCGPVRALGYAAVVGGRRGTSAAPFGEYYYLDSYERVVATLGSIKRGHCMVRYAAVVGRQGMLLGRPTDRPDSSAMTRHVAMVRPIVRASSRARDADGKWTRTCDSLGRGRLAVELGGTRHTMEPRLCVKAVTSFVPLEYWGFGIEDSGTAVSSTVSYTPEHEHAE